MDLSKLLKQAEAKAKRDKKKNQTENKAETNDKPKKKVQDDQDNDAIVLVDIEQMKDTDKPKSTVVVRQIVEEDIKYEAPVQQKPAEPKRTTWVVRPGEKTHQAAFNMENEKEHFVGIGQQYNPKPDYKPGVSNFKPLQLSEQERKLNALEGPTVPAATIATTGHKPRFTNSTSNQTGAMQKTPQQLKEEELEAKMNGLKGTTMTKQQKQAREIEKKRRQEEAAKALQLGTGEQKRFKVVGTQKQTNVQNPPVKQLEKTPQQLKEEELEAKSNQLKGTALTKQQAELRKQKAIEREQKRKQEQQAQIQLKLQEAQVPESRKPRFTNSKKTTQGPLLMELQKNS